jgi:hypothetical protein
MKNVIKKTTVILSLFLASQTFSNVVDSITLFAKEEKTVIKFNKIDAFTSIKFKDKNGETLYNDKINEEGVFANLFDLSNLPDATYYFELETKNEIRTIPIVIDNQNIEQLNDQEAITAKPHLKTENQMVRMTQNSANDQDFSVSIYHEGRDLIYKETIKKAEELNRTYDFEGSMQGEYLIVVSTNGEVFSKKIRILDNER